MLIFDFIMIMIIHVLIYNVGRVCQKLYFLKIKIINIYNYIIVTSCGQPMNHNERQFNEVWRYDFL